MIDELFGQTCLMRAAILRSEDRRSGADIVPAGEAQTVWLVAQYLRYLGYKRVDCVEGTRTIDGHRIRKHWVETQGCVVDITAAALPYCESPVIVSEHSVFHSLFKSTDRTRVTANSLKARSPLVKRFEALLAASPALHRPALATMATD